MSFAFLGMGGTEVLVVMGAVLVLFGSKKIPEFAKGLGSAMREFKKASADVSYELQNAMNTDPVHTPPPSPPPAKLPAPPETTVSTAPAATVPKSP